MKNTDFNNADDSNKEFDANGDLISKDTNTQNMEPLAYLDEDNSKKLVEFLHFSGIEDTYFEYNELNSLYSVLVPSKSYEKASNLYNVYCEENDNQDSSSIIQNAIESEFIDGNSLYENATEKYKDNLSSAITFFICGFAGIIFLILNFIGVINVVATTGPSGILMNSVLGALFIIFIVIATRSYIYSKKIKVQAEHEDEAKEQVFEWLSEHASIDDIESSYDTSIPEEMKYFNRSEYIKNTIKNNFPDLDNETIEFINDTYIEQTFQNIQSDNEYDDEYDDDDIDKDNDELNK